MGLCQLNNRIFCLCMCNYLINKYVVTLFKICHIIFLIVINAIKLTELDGGINNAHFLNFKN
jgi:hypothetical protein